MRNTDEETYFRSKVKELMDAGVYDQNTIFSILYPTYEDHYSRLRDIISEAKNDDANSTR